MLDGNAEDWTLGSYANTIVKSAPKKYSTEYKVTGKYVNDYKFDVNANSFIYGDALMEVSSGVTWFGDAISLPYIKGNASRPVILRGGSYNEADRAGLFAATGSYGNSIAFHIILAP